MEWLAENIEVLAGIVTAIVTAILRITGRVTIAKKIDAIVPELIDIFERHKSARGEDKALDDTVDEAMGRLTTVDKALTVGATKKIAKNAIKSALKKK